MSHPPNHEPGKLGVSLSIVGIPELEARLRRDLARILRECADDEPAAVAARLREIADLFEAGLSEEPH